MIASSAVDLPAPLSPIKAFTFSEQSKSNLLIALKFSIVMCLIFIILVYDYKDNDINLNSIPYISSLIIAEALTFVLTIAAILDLQDERGRQGD